MKIIIKFSGDAKIGIYRRSQNTVEFDPRSGIAVLIDKRVVSSLEKEKVYKISNPRFRTLEKCVILEGNFSLVAESECEAHRSYAESIYITHPVRVVNVQYRIALTGSVKINSLGQVEEISETTDCWRKSVVKEAVEYEDSPLPFEYQWMLEKIRDRKEIFKFGDIFVTKEENPEILDAKIVTPQYMRMAEYTIKTNSPVYMVSYGEYKEEWKGQKLFHLNLPELFSGSPINTPENGVVKIITSFQGDAPKWEDSIKTDRHSEVDDGEMQLSGFGRMIYQSPSYTSSNRRSTPTAPRVVDINRSGNVTIVTFWGRRYAVAFDYHNDNKCIDHLVSIDEEEMEVMVRERDERIKKETFELYRTRFILAMETEGSLSIHRYIEDYFSGKYSEGDDFLRQFSFSFPVEFNYSGNKTGLYLQLEILRGQVVENLKNTSKMEDLGKIKASYLLTIKAMEDTYKKGLETISNFSKLFSEILKETLVSFVNEDVRKMYEEIRALESIACDGDLKKLEQAIEALRQKAVQLPGISVSQKETEDAREVETRKNLLAKAGQLGIPEYLLAIFKGDIERSIQFMSNIEKIETWRLDEHELSCGRGRARTICENAWRAQGELSDFFCGADPNDVKGYILEYHFGENSTGNFSNSVSEEPNTETFEAEISAEEEHEISLEDLKRLQEKFGK